MSNSREYGRTGFSQPRGNPAGGNRNQRRAYDYRQRQALETDWNEVKDFEVRQPKPRGQTTRSKQWKESNIKRRKEKRKEPQLKKDDPGISYDFKSKDETSPVDEPLYDLGPHTNSIPVQEIYSQNVDLAGYVDQVERTYEMLRGIDPRLDRRMPFSMFQHSMTTVANCYLIDLAKDNGDRKLDGTICQDLLPEDLCIPDNLFHYLTNIGNTTTANGEEVKFNLPDTAVPQPQNGVIPSGTFGPLTPQNHNLYECYISPLVTANRVLD